METPDDNHCHPTGNESSAAFQHENQKHLSPNSQSESDVVQCSPDAVARGLSSTLATVIRDFDSRAQDTLRSQDQLSFALDRLTRGFYFFSSLSSPFMTLLAKLWNLWYASHLCACVLNQFISMIPCQLIGIKLDRSYRVCVHSWVYIYVRVLDLHILHPHRSSGSSQALDKVEIWRGDGWMV